MVNHFFRKYSSQKEAHTAPWPQLNCVAVKISATHVISTAKLKSFDANNHNLQSVAFFWAEKDGLPLLLSVNICIYFKCCSATFIDNVYFDNLFVIYSYRKLILTQDIISVGGFMLLVYSLGQKKYKMDEFSGCTCRAHGGQWLSLGPLFPNASTPFKSAGAVTISTWACTSMRYFLMWSLEGENKF